MQPGVRNPPPFPPTFVTVHVALWGAYLHVALLMPLAGKGPSHSFPKDPHTLYCSRFFGRLLMYTEIAAIYGRAIVALVATLAPPGFLWHMCW